MIVVKKLAECCLANVAATRNVCARCEMAMMALPSIVRRPVTASASRRQHTVCVSRGLSQAMDFQDQQINLGLLPHNDLVQLFKQVVGIAGFDFKGVQALVGMLGMVGMVGMVDGHGTIGYRNGVSPPPGLLACLRVGRFRRLVRSTGADAAQHLQHLQRVGAQRVGSRQPQQAVVVVVV